ncbi:MAG: type II toxin-antitoxin system Phd/YefM family antitoxin [Thermomicrobiales bacterium]
MVSAGPMNETMKMTDAKQQFSRVVNAVFRTQKRVLVEKGGIPVAAIVSTEDLERLNQLDAEWEQGFERSAPPSRASIRPRLNARRRRP